MLADITVDAVTYARLQLFMIHRISQNERVILALVTISHPLYYRQIDSATLTFNLLKIVIINKILFCRLTISAKQENWLCQWVTLTHFNVSQNKTFIFSMSVRFTLIERGVTFQKFVYGIPVENRKVQSPRLFFFCDSSHFGVSSHFDDFSWRFDVSDFLW